MPVTVSVTVPVMFADTDRGRGRPARCPPGGQERGQGYLPHAFRVLFRTRQPALVEVAVNGRPAHPTRLSSAGSGEHGLGRVMVVHVLDRAATGHVDGDTTHSPTVFYGQGTGGESTRLVQRTHSVRSAASISAAATARAVSGDRWNAPSSSSMRRTSGTSPRCGRTARENTLSGPPERVMTVSDSHARTLTVMART